MSQVVELPQLSLQRYLDLVKRRRWSLIPVSLLGLAIGALVAFLIPRYYVAEAVVEYHGVGDERAQRGVEDPFAEIVDRAEDTIRLAAGAAMETLRWPEALTSDPSVRTLHEKEVQSRLFVYDRNAHERGRSYAQMRVVYSDTDPRRAADLTNTVVAQWVKDQTRNLREPREAERSVANDRRNRASSTVTTLREKQRQLYVQYRLRRDLDMGEQLKFERERRAAIAERKERIAEKEGELAELRRSIANTQEKLEATPPRIELGLPELLKRSGDNPVVKANLEMLFLRELALRRSWGPGAREFVAQKRALEREKQRLLDSLAIDRDENGRIANPEFDLLGAALQAAKARETKLDRELEILKRDAVDEDREIANLAEGGRQIDQVERDIEDAQKDLDDANADVKRLDAVLARLAADNPVSVPIKALPPPHPTDPNLFIVAGIGALLGLGVAIALILLLDFLQGSFKTADEVERGLGVPVLGAMSHLETAEERLAVVRGRRRVSAVALGFVALVVVVVTIYYRAPTRLPGPVRDLLALLLGS